MAERIAFIKQKRTALKSQITNLGNLLDKEDASNAILKLRVARLTQLYYAFEEYHDELAILDANSDHDAEFGIVQERFYTVAGKIEERLSTLNESEASTSASSQTTRTDTTAGNRRRIKLPEAPLPTFDGQYENWLTFKSAFNNVIGSQTDLSDIDKLHYLKAALVGEAANKINIFSATEANYDKAWDLLERSYEVKRVLISRHLSLILNLATLERESASGLTKLADEAQQHLASLHVLGVEVGAEMMVHVVEGKLPRNTLEKWETSLEKDEVPTFDKMIEFLYKCAVCASKRERTKASDASRRRDEPHAKKRRFQVANQAFVVHASRGCACCHSESHALATCDRFKRLPVQKRIEVVRVARLCYVCLRSHLGSPCKSAGCSVCHKRHNVMLHLTKHANSITEVKPAANSNAWLTERGNSATSVADSAPAIAPQLVASAVVYVSDKKGKLMQCRALLDTCATVNFITEAFLRRLGVPAIKRSMPVGMINDANTVSKGIAQIVVHSARDKFRKELTCLTIPSITDLSPNETFPRNAISIPPNIKLADPDFHIPRSVDLLLGSGATFSVFCVGQINLSKEGRDLYLQKTRFGWVIAGGDPAQASAKRTKCHVTDLETQIAKFWTMEEVAVGRFKSDEENKCETHFIETVSRDRSGRYIVRLPFREAGKGLGESRAIALKRFAALERKLTANANLKTEYARVLEEYITLKHMTLIDDPDDTGYYMPHHEVIKESSNTTKVRVVFDASAKTKNGVSLNDVLMVGPTIQARLVEHLIRFRTYNYVLTADIEKMYRQVWVHKDDRHYQQILWRKHDEIQTYQLNTLTFGVSSSPFLAIRAVQKLADDERHEHPKAAHVLTKHLYVDDLLTGADTIAEARSIRDDVISALARGGFTIRQWASNHERLISDLEASALHANVVLKIDDSLKTLGIAWDTRDDIIHYSAQPIKVGDRVTKRNILSEIAKIFDPMGLLGPIVLHAKKLMQDVWRCGAQWDESIPQSIHTEWSEFSRQLGMIGQISFDRKLFVIRDVQIHGFCDASIVGYGACVYVRSRGNHGVTSVKLVCAKSRVAPLKTVTIPRLELCGAVLLAQLCREVGEALNMSSRKRVLWCDSTIVLHWLQTSPHLLKTFVANRVAQIQELTSTTEWRHVRSEDNPADALSRGQLPHAFAHNKTWKSGPSWLLKPENKWPEEVARSIEIPELKAHTCLLTKSDDNVMFAKYSSYSKLLRVIAYCLRFRPGNKHTGALRAQEINSAEIKVLRILQATRFANEIQELKSKGSGNKVKLAALNPFLDDEGLVRVGGRLQGSQLTFSQKHPILLPSRHPVTDIIVRELHERHLHAGIQTTLCLLRQKFWLCDGRNQIRKVVRNCTRCFRYRAETIQYKMGNLPAARVCESVPFTSTGVDFCGPFHVKEKKFRNRDRIKVYVCVFVCMVIKAIHLELVSDLSSDGFLAALRRFVARRGLPEHIYSDNGTNFVGANKQLKELYELHNSEAHTNQVSEFASQHRINWHFIPSVAPHFGGLWEASVKLFKHHLRRVVGDSLFTFDELNTLTIEIEGILNSRPITSPSSDPNDMLALTPAHYLIGKPLTTLPEGDLSVTPVNRLSTWQHISKVRQHFWARWSLEYLNELQMRHKWIKDGPTLSSGTVVLIKDKNLPCSHWALGRVTSLFPGKDGIVRAAIIKTATGEIKRAVNYLCPLPIEQPDATTTPPNQ